MPQKSNIIGTKTVSGEVHIFDLNLHPSRPASDTPSHSITRLSALLEENNPMLKGDHYTFKTLSV